MKITKINLSNFRGVESLSLELHGKLNVLYGMNGTGKSTILHAIAIMLSWTIQRIKSIQSNGKDIPQVDIKNGSHRSSIEIFCSDNNREIFWRRTNHLEGYGLSEERSDFTHLNEYVKQIQDEIAAQKEKINLPLFVYYPVNRAVLDIPLRIKSKHKFDLLAAYEDALTSGANFRTFFEWFRDREDRENQNRKYIDALIKPEDYVFPDPQLEAVRQALQEFLPEFKNINVIRNNPPRMEVTKNGEILRIDQLSDGEKCLIAMISDLARRLAIANPKRDNPLEGEGIVLIDEIELHLHPKWQRMIVSKLLEVFPNCQFIISTHSPNVITHVKPESLYLLEQFQGKINVSKPQESYGKTVERILEDLMGLTTTRPDEVNVKLREIYDKIQQGNLDEAKQMIVSMRKIIAEDPELVKAEVLIKRKEIIGK